MSVSIDFFSIDMNTKKIQFKPCRRIQMKSKVSAVYGFSCATDKDTQSYQLM